jgi:hypothetical protein
MKNREKREWDYGKSEARVVLLPLRRDLNVRVSPPTLALMLRSFVANVQIAKDPEQERKFFDEFATLTSNALAFGKRSLGSAFYDGPRSSR